MNTLPILLSLALATPVAGPEDPAPDVERLEAWPELSREQREQAVTGELAGALGLAHLTQDIATVSADGLVAAWREIEACPSTFGPGFWARVEEMRDGALSSGDLVRAALDAADRAA